MRFCPDSVFDSKVCIGCATCAKVCPSGAVALEEGHPCFDMQRCIGCGHCGGYCPSNSFHLEPLPAGSGCIDPHEMAIFLQRRRSIRCYQDKEPSEEEIKELVSVLSMSPTGQNSQGVMVRAVTGRSSVESLLEPLRRFIRTAGPSGLPWLAGRLSGYGHQIRRFMAGEDLVFHGAPVVLFFHVDKSGIMWRNDGIIAACGVEMKAMSMGLGTLWNGIAQKLYPLVPSWHMEETRGTGLSAVMCVGYSAIAQLWSLPDRDYRLVVEGGIR